MKKPECDLSLLLGDCLARRRKIAAKVTERCRTLLWGRSELLLYVNLKLPFHSAQSTRRSCSVCNSFSSLSQRVKQPTIVLAASHFRVLLSHFSKEAPDWCWFSQHTHWHCNWVKQKEPKIDCSLLQDLSCSAPPVAMLLCLNIGSQLCRVNTRRWYSREKGQPTRERNTNGSGAYLHVNVWFMFSLSLSGRSLLLKAKHLSTGET